MGDLDAADTHENAVALKQGFSVFSAYRLPGTGVKVRVIAGADRSATTLLLPDEY